MNHLPSLPFHYLLFKGLVCADFRFYHIAGDIIVNLLIINSLDGVF